MNVMSLLLTGPRELRHPFPPVSMDQAAGPRHFHTVVVQPAEL